MNIKKIVFLGLFSLVSFISNAQFDTFRSGVILGFSPNKSILESAPLNVGLTTEFILPILKVGAEVDMLYESKAFQLQNGSFSYENNRHNLHEAVLKGHKYCHPIYYHLYNNFDLSLFLQIRELSI
jgi:hypothetical protein